MRMIEERAMLVVCDDCGARAPCDRVHVTFARMDPSTREPGLANTNALDLPDGWTEGRVTPEGRPVLVAGGVVRVDPYKDASRRGEPRVAVRISRDRLAVMTFADAEDLRERLRLLQAVALEVTL